MGWEFRTVTMKDSEQLFTWRNSEEVYRFLFNPHPISLEGHQIWLSKIIEQKNVLFLLALNDAKAIGTVRFDFSDDFQEAEIGIYLGPEWHGKGLGAPMLLNAEAECRRRFPKIQKMVAKVLIDNVASEKMFEKCGYSKKFIQLEKRMEK